MSSAPTLESASTVTPSASAAGSSDVIDTAAGVLVRAMAGDIEFEDVLQVSFFMFVEI